MIGRLIWGKRGKTKERHRKSLKGVETQPLFFARPNLTKGGVDVLVCGVKIKSKESISTNSNEIVVSLRPCLEF
jgi:hypothetical protein